MEQLSVVVVGAGLAGIASAVKLLEAGIEDFVVLERANRVGGTWRGRRISRGPRSTCLHGCTRCRSPRIRKWSKMNCPAPEILAYIEDVVRRFGGGSACAIRDRGRARGVSTTVAGGWQVVDCRRPVVQGEGLDRRRRGVGQRGLPQHPRLETFGGQRILSAHWPKGCDLTGKRVAVVGTGASAVQIVPELVKQAAHVTVFQRTPAFCAPPADLRVAESLKGCSANTLSRRGSCARCSSSSMSCCWSPPPGSRR